MGWENANSVNDKFEGGCGEQEIRGTNEGGRGSKKFGARMRADGETRNSGHE